MEGFDRGTNAWLYLSGGTAGTIVSGRTGSCLKQSGNPAYILLNNFYSELVVGFAFYSETPFQYGRTLSLNNSGNGKNVNVYISSVGELGVNVRNSVTYWSGVFIEFYKWYYIELKAKFHRTTGYFILRLNGVKIKEEYNINTVYNSSNPDCRIIEFNAVAFTSFYYDDVYICDTTGTKNNDFLGDVKVVTVFPTRDGTYNDFSVVGASDRYDAVNETNPNNNTDYVTASGIGNMQTFGFTAPTISGSVLGLKAQYMMRKDDAGDRFVKLVGLFNSNLYESSSYSLTTDYSVLPYETIHETRIGSSEDWSISDINNVEFGVKVVDS
jgi:hypothetical protein